MGKLEHLKRLIKLFDGMKLTEVVDLLFSKYEGELANVNNAEVIRLCHRAQAIFKHLTPSVLDFCELGVKYRLNANTRKVWCPTVGIRADRDHFNPKWQTVVHHKIVRYDCKTYLNDWWREITTVNNLVVKEMTIYLCSEPFDALVIIRSRVVDIQDRHLRGTWNKLTRAEKDALLKCPTSDQTIQESWDLALTSSNFLRAAGQLDTHQCREHIWGMVYAAMLQLVNAEEATTTVNGETVKYAKCKNGMVGVSDWDKLGTSVRVVVGRMSNTKRHDKSNDKTWAGKMHTDMLVIMMMTTGNVKFGSETGYINIHRENIKPGAKHLLKCLRDNAYEFHCLPTPESVLQRTPGYWIQRRMCEMSILLQGYTNQTGEQLIGYEACPCFIDSKMRFHRTMFLRICEKWT